MRIFDAILAKAPSDARIEEMIVGVFWTLARTQYGAAMSATAHRWVEDPPGAIIPGAGHLVGKTVHELAPLYNSASLTARAVALSALSAAFDNSSFQSERVLVGVSAQTHLALICAQMVRPPHVALIGHFHFANALRKMARQLDIFELENRCQAGDIASTNLPERLPDADIVVMTSSTLLTHATETILSHARSDAYKMIVGPTALLHPIMWDYGFDAIGGSVISNAQATSQALREGANHRQLEDVLKIVMLRPKV